MDRFHRRRIAIGFGIMVLLAAGVAHPAGVVRAEDDAPAKTEQPEVVVRTEEVVVSATKTPVPVMELTSAVEVIKGEELERRKIKMIVDALRLSPGLAVFSNGGPGSNATARIRGGTSAQTLVLIDGAVVNSPTTGEFNFANLTTDSVERIEILRGAQSMLWGADAIGGVINIITKRGRGTPNVSAFVEYGSFLSLREGGTFSGQKGPIDLSMALSRWDFTGFSTVNYRRGATERDSFRNWQASSKLGIALPNDGRFEFNFRWLNGDVNIDNVATFGTFDVSKAKNSTQQFIYSGQYEQPLTEWWNQRLTLARGDERVLSQSGTLRRNVETGVVDTPFFFPGDIQTQTNRLEWQHNFQVGDPLLLSLGYQFREALGTNVTTTPPLIDKIISSNSGFAEAQVNLGERLYVTGGVRQDSFNTVGDATTYRVTGGLLVPETGSKVRGSYGTGFRAPTINDLFFPGFGNPGLKPEKSQSFDVAVEQSFLQDRVNATVGYFWNRFRDLIVTATDPVACAFSLFGQCPLNIGSAKSQGWETGLTVQLLKDLTAVKSLDLTANYTYTLTRDLETAARLPRWPVHQWSGVLRYQPVDRFRINVAYRHVGSRFNTTGNQQPIEPFDVVSLSATYDLSKQVQVYTRVENLFDEEYEEVLNFGTPIRSIYGGVRVNFDLPLEFADHVIE